MPTIKTSDKAEIYYKHWGQGTSRHIRPRLALCADAWDPQMLFLVQHGYRCVAHDRRGQGRSTQWATGNDMDTYADHFAAVMDALDLKDTTLGSVIRPWEVKSLVTSGGTAWSG